MHKLVLLCQFPYEGLKEVSGGGDGELTAADHTTDQRERKICRRMLQHRFQARPEETRSHQAHKEYPSYSKEGSGKSCAEGGRGGCMQVRGEKLDMSRDRGWWPQYMAGLLHTDRRSH